MPLSDLLLSRDASIRDAMAAIDRGAVEIALVVDADSRLVGTVSDGDVRRALLAGHALCEPVLDHICQEPRTVPIGTDRSQVLDLMRSESITQIPEVDEGNRVVALHNLQNLLGAARRRNAAIILTEDVGGTPTRSGGGHLSPMRRVAGRPILERLILHLMGAGIGRVFLAVSAESGGVEEHFGDGSGLGCTIEYLRGDDDHAIDSDPVRALLARESGPGAPLIVMDVGVVSGFSVENLLAAHESSGAVATVAVNGYAHTVPFGVSETSGTRLINLVEKPAQTWLVGAGIYVLDPCLLDEIPAGRFIRDIDRMLEDRIAAGDVVGTSHVDHDPQDLVQSAPIDPQRLSAESVP